ncbi:MAG: ImmA/IrrE family metallo-endopeptidase [Gammaproteobacteria bacterium]|nr:ImmA/IrrE family metallo-endopeptidase [Gammaproteobacteria bacterium]
MRRGFKSLCERIAESKRRELGLELTQPLDPHALAAHLDVMVWKPEDVPGLKADSLSQLVQRDSDSWSAVTLRVEQAQLTIVNSAHSPTRQTSSIAHELAHLLLEHEPDRIDLSEDGHLLLSSFERDQEDEATWLAGALLVPREGLRRAFYRSKNEQLLASQFGVSVQLLQWRLRMTGVALQARRARSFKARA